MKRLHNNFYHSKNYNDYIELLGYKRFPNDRIMPNEQSFLVVYCCPNEYNHLEIQSKPWFNLEVFNKNELQETVNLEKLVGEVFYHDSLGGKWSGKWVYLSMGSMGSIDLSLMKRILEAISETSHKYIVSKGPRHSEYDLPQNAWGDRYLPQTKILALMDLVITHGGNNTVTETFAHGKPMIVFSLFGDQYDNSARLHETGFGIRLEPYQFVKCELIEAINKLLFDEPLNLALQKASNRIHNSQKHEELASLVEGLLAKQLK